VVDGAGADRQREDRQCGQPVVSVATRRGHGMARGDEGKGLPVTFILMLWTAGEPGLAEVLVEAGMIESEPAGEGGSFCGMAEGEQAAEGMVVGDAEGFADLLLVEPFEPARG